jgi:hypothetical protein
VGGTMGGRAKNGLLSSKLNFTSDHMQHELYDYVADLPIRTQSTVETKYEL